MYQLNKMMKFSDLRIKRYFSISSALNKKNVNRKDINNRLYELLDNMDKEEVNLANAMSVRVEKRPKTKIKNIYPQKQPSTIFWQVRRTLCSATDKILIIN